MINHCETLVLTTPDTSIRLGSARSTVNHHTSLISTLPLPPPLPPPPPSPSPTHLPTPARALVISDHTSTCSWRGFSIAYQGMLVRRERRFAPRWPTFPAVASFGWRSWSLRRRNPRQVRLYSRIIRTATLRRNFTQRERCRNTREEMMHEHTRDSLHRLFLFLFAGWSLFVWEIARQV